MPSLSPLRLGFAATTAAFIGSLSGCASHPPEDRVGVVSHAVDPMNWAQGERILSVDIAQGDRLGDAVAVAGGTLLVGAPSHASTGAAYFFERGPTGAWTQVQALRPLDENAQFGTAVAITNTRALVGSPAGDDGSVTAVERMTTGWQPTALLRASEAGHGDFFGCAVALDGTTALVGARQDDDAGGSTGSAYFFSHGDSGWSDGTKVLADDASAASGFGASVAVRGNLALVGAPTEASMGVDAGAVYLFERASDAWVQTAKWYASDGGHDAQFGATLALGDGVAVIGRGDTTGGAYVFEQSGGSWTETARLAAPGIDERVRFGAAVALSASTVLVGAPDAFGAGAAFTFERLESGWGTTHTWTPPDDTAGQWFGSAVALDDTRGLVGAWRRTDAGPDSGAAFSFSGTRDDGASCGADEGCASGHCVDGVCCDSPCPGACFTCAAPGSEGTCVASDEGPACGDITCEGAGCDPTPAPAEASDAGSVEPRGGCAVSGVGSPAPWWLVAVAAAVLWRRRYPPKPE